MEVNGYRVEPDANLSGANLSCANLRGANLSCANLSCADLWGANLSCAIGNMQEVRSMQIEQWHITWCQPLGGEPQIWIGCQVNTLQSWRKNGAIKCERQTGSRELWDRLGTKVLDLIEAAPAVPWSRQEVKS